MQNIFKKSIWNKAFSMTVALVLLTTSAWAAADYYLYNKQDTNDAVTFDAATAESYMVAMCYIPDTATTWAGRMLMATGTNVYLQDAVDSSNYTQVATVSAAMDASFIKVSPDGQTIALGLGYDQDLLIFPLGSLSSSTPPVLNTDANTTVFSSSVVKYYDAAWADNTHLVINGGFWDEDTDTAYNAGISCLDISSSLNTPVPVITTSSYPGASSGIAVDSSKNLIFGNGYTYSTTSETGELVMLPVDDWWSNGAPIGTAVAYPSSNVIAESVLSAASLGFDEEGNLHVGGGDYASVWGGATDVYEIGFVALINKNVLSDAADAIDDGYSPDLLDETNATQYREFNVDSCSGTYGAYGHGNDSANYVLSYGRSLTINWINGGDCTSLDTYGSGITSKLTILRIDETRDGDSDSYYDVDDNSPWTYHTNNTDTDGDGYGNIIDGDFDNDGEVGDSDVTIFAAAYENTTNMQCDLDGDGDVDDADFTLLAAMYEDTAPYYNTSF